MLAASIKFALFAPNSLPCAGWNHKAHLLTAFSLLIQRKLSWDSSEHVSIGELSGVAASKRFHALSWFQFIVQKRASDSLCPLRSLRLEYNFSLRRFQYPQFPQPCRRKIIHSNLKRRVHPSKSFGRDVGKFRADVSLFHQPVVRAGDDSIFFRNRPVIVVRVLRNRIKPAIGQLLRFRIHPVISESL